MQGTWIKLIEFHQSEDDEDEDEDAAFRQISLFAVLQSDYWILCNS